MIEAVSLLAVGCWMGYYLVIGCTRLRTLSKRGYNRYDEMVRWVIINLFIFTTVVIVLFLAVVAVAPGEIRF